MVPHPGWLFAVTAAATDDLSRPLGVAGPARRMRFSISAPQAFGGLAALMALVLAAQIHFARRSGDASVTVIERRAGEAPAATGPAVAIRAEPAQGGERPQMSAQELENAAGVTVVRGGGVGAPTSIVIQAPEPEKPRIAAPVAKLLEKARSGALPRIAADGTRPSVYYARPTPSAAADRPRIAILVGGLGISQAATADAIAKLPEAVSLAFAPYGGDLDRQAQRARAEGHELFLQAPMEPFDYPDSDPGPHTLRTGLSDADNIERLHWVMARLQGYVGIVNFMGGRFTAQDSALTPIVREVAARGLIMADDGSSNRSQIVAVGAGLKAPALRADIVLDAQLRPDAIDRELAKLERIAREKGVAVGMASALPVSIDRIARWAKTLEGKGISLVPASNTLLRRGDS